MIKHVLYPATMSPAQANIATVQNIVGQITPLISEASTKIAALPPGSSDKTATIQSLANVFSVCTTVWYAMSRLTDRLRYRPFLLPATSS